MINKFQQGGELQLILTVIALFLLLNGLAQDPESAMESAQELFEAAQSGDENAKSALQQILKNTTKARLGAKLNYIKRLRGECPEGTEMTYYKAGGRICKACMGKRMGIGGEVTDTAKVRKPIKVKPNIPKRTPAEQLRINRLSEQDYFNGTADHLRYPSPKPQTKKQTTKKAKGGILANKGTAFGDCPKHYTPRNTDHAGHKSHGNTRAASQLKKTNIPNKFTAFGDTGKYKPTNVGLVGHRATGKTGKMQSKETVSDNVNKHTAFGAHINKTHRGKSTGQPKGWQKIKGAPRGHGGKSGWFKYGDGGSLNGGPFNQLGRKLKKRYDSTLNRISNVAAGYPATETRQYTVEDPFNTVGQEYIDINFAPDRGRTLNLTRVVYPRQDGTFDNDTLYSATMFNGNYKSLGNAYESKGKSGEWLIIGPKLSLSGIGRPLFKSWGDYFEYLLRNNLYK